MQQDGDKERMWKKLSTIPDPLLVTIQQAGNLSVPKRFILQKYLGYTTEQIDEFLDGYPSER